MFVVFLRVVDVADAAADKIIKPAFVYPLAGFFEVFTMDFLNNFKDFFAEFFSSAFSFSDFLLFAFCPFVISLFVKIFNKVRFGKC